MQNLPPATVYEQLFTSTPWGKITQRVHGHICRYVPENGTVLDLLCGPGHLLGEVHKKRPDLRLFGIDADPKFIEYAHTYYSNPKVTFVAEDVLKLETERKFDAVVCTGGVHHLPDNQQEAFIAKISSLVATDGFAIIADPYIRDFTTAQERMISSVELGAAYLADSIKMGASPEAIETAVQIMKNDLLLVEWKTSVKKRRSMLESHFLHITQRKTWPKGRAPFGDYYFTLRK